MCETPFAYKRCADGWHCSQNWAGIKCGDTVITLFNKGTAAFEINNNTFAFGLLRSYSNYRSYYIEGKKLGLDEFADDNTHTTLANERGTTVIEYALTSGDFDVYELSKAAMTYQNGLCVLSSNVKTDRFIKCIEKPFIVTQLKQTQDGVVIRGYYASEKPGTCRIQFEHSVKKVCEMNLRENEHIRSLEIIDNTVELNCRPFDIITLSLRIGGEDGK